MSAKPSPQMGVKRVLILARKDHREAMRVAAGLTIFDHSVSLVFMDRKVSADDAESDAAELLELVEITPMSTIQGMHEHMAVVSSTELANIMGNCDVVINV